MKIINLLTILFGFLTLIGPAIVLSKNSKSSKSNLLFLMALVTGPLWSISIGLFFLTDDLYVARIALNSIYTVSVIIAVLTFFFTKTFPYKTSSKLTEKILLFIPAIFVLYEVWLTDSFITYLDMSKTPQFGYTYIIWVVWFALIIASRIAVLGRNLKDITEIERRQTVYLVVGLAISGLGMAPSNVILPYIGIYQYVWIGPIMGFIMISLISYGISTLRFANLKTLLRSFFLFFSYAILPSLMLGFLLIVILGIPFSFQGILITSTFSLASFYLLSKAKGKIVGTEELTQTLSNKVSTILSIENVSKELSNFILPILRSETLNVLVTDKNNSEVYQYGKLSSVDTTNFPLADIVSYSSYYKDSEKIVVLQELKHLQISSIEEQNIWRYKRFLSLVEYMGKKGVSVIVPISLRNGYNAFLILGPKKKEDMYVAEELKFLAGIKNTVRVLFERSLLYQEVEMFNKSLQQKVDDQTQELQVKVKQLQEARRKESDMIDIMGHELRTPATIVKLNVSLLEKYVKTNPEEFKKYLDRIKQAIETEIALINTLLMSAKLEGNKIEIKREKVDVGEEIEMSIHGHEEELNSDTRLVSNIPKNLGYAYADRVRVAEVLNNLIGNAIKFTDNGLIVVSAKSDNKHIQISVKDSGKGIARNNVSRLGEKFFRVDNYLDSDIVRPGGTGLGLYITYRLVRLMGGDIKVESKVGEGSTFVFTLPKYKGQQISASQDSVDRFKRLGLKK